MMCEAIVATGKLIQMQVVPALSDMIAENERDMRGWQAMVVSVRNLLFPFRYALLH